MSNICQYVEYIQDVRHWIVFRAEREGAGESEGGGKSDDFLKYEERQRELKKPTQNERSTSDLPCVCTCLPKKQKNKTVSVRPFRY